MRVGITGHTKGIGRAAYNLLKSRGYLVSGFSRTNGYDITSNFELVLETVLSSNLDVFINNAYANHYQTNLLKRTYDAWKFRDKLLVNIGSAASLIPKEHPDYNMEYASDKREQRNFCAEQNFLYSKENFNMVKCCLTNINCDYVSTDFKSKHDKRKYPNLNPDEVANTILFVIESFNRKICVREINMHSIRDPVFREDRALDDSF